MTPPSQLQEFATRWSGVKAAERANAQSYVIELCTALGVEPPRPAGSGYEFELPIKLTARDGTESQGFVDCYKERHFVLEAKDYEEGRSNDVLMRKAYGQARMYASHDPTGMAPPYLLVLDVGKSLLVWDRWAGTFGGFAAARRIDLSKLQERPEDAMLLVDIWTRPTSRDPRLAAQAVTKEIAAHLAELAKSLQERGFDQERVARFLMRCTFTCFAEDVGLLPDHPFRRLLDEIAIPNPTEFPGAAEELWRAMDEGRRFGFRKLLRFNGHFFRDAEGLPLTREDLAVLLEAAKADWSRVDPTIFGTLLTRALDPVERHRLGAEYTPPEFIERLIRPTIEEPVRARWTAVQAELIQLRDTGRPKDRDKGEQRLREFHEWLRSLSVLDPACGSGNFLYLAMHTLKRIEVEVLHELADIRGGALELRMQEVDPSQFHGIEVKPWAREIAELTLWIGFHQFWRLHHGDVQPDEPLLRDTGTLEGRDAVLEWDELRHNPERDRPDPTPRLVSAVTGDLIPDPQARLQYVEYVGARQAPWPDADFIIGNPPYLGQSRQREAFGDGYVDALRGAYPEMPDSADYVMYWWYRAAEKLRSDRPIRAGFITTNSIVQAQNRAVVALEAQRDVRVIWAIADHPWIDSSDGAAVRVAMTTMAHRPTSALRIDVDAEGRTIAEHRVPRLNEDLSAFADVPSASGTPLLANRGLCSPGFKLHGAGFILSPEEAAEVLRLSPEAVNVIKPYRNGKDLAARPRGVFVIDFGLLDESSAQRYPIPFDMVRDRVKPDRDANGDRGTREKWWRFGRNREDLRAALVGLPRYIATVETSKHRYFTFLDAAVAPDNMLMVIASQDAFVLGVLSSSIHVTWALAAGGRLGVGNDPRYNKGVCFDAFPFPAATTEQRNDIARVAEALCQHRNSALAGDERVTMTGMYNVVAKLRSGEPLTLKERAIHTAAACGTLRDLHDELNRLVATTYGWSPAASTDETLLRLIELHDLRVEEERTRVVRWIRPEFQVPNFGGEFSAENATLQLEDSASTSEARLPRWPTDAIGQITAIRLMALSAPVSVEEAATCFLGAPRALVARHLETLAILGEVRQEADGRYTGPASKV